MTIESKVKQQYDLLAQIYDRRWHTYVNHSLTFLETYMKISGQERILDIACGTGELERLLYANHPNLKITGIDISDKMLDMARSKFSDSSQSHYQVEFQQSSAIALPFTDHSFDIVVTASAFHYFEYPQAVLNEIRRVLKPTGKLIILDWCRDFWYCQIFDIFLKIIDPAYKGCYTKKELNNFLVKANFKVENEQKLKIPPLWGMMAATSIKIKF